jgi:glycine cleavage system P protein (glycine dehydrogenase) subunit 1
MPDRKPVIYPYIPNSAPAVKAEMLREIGVNRVEDLYADIPGRLRFKGRLNLPDPLHSETELTRHVDGLLNKNRSTREALSFLGAGCYQHQVPAVCDEINSRGEFLTAYAGDPYEDHGRFQALFEYESLMAELLNMEVVNVPNYDGFQASATALRMACRITGRTTVLLPQNMSTDKFSKLAVYLQPDIAIERFSFDPQTGLTDLAKLRAKLTRQIAAVYFENPTYLGLLETRVSQISAAAHAVGALCVVSVEPLSLGVIRPPVEYGAEIVCGDIQTLGIHMNYGGGHGGFIASNDDPKFVMEFPSRLFGVAPTVVEGEYGFGDVAYERTSFALREAGKEWVGTAAALWGITAGVYLALMGPQGMQEIGEGLMQRCRYAMLKIAVIPGLQVTFADTPHFTEFVVNFDRTPKNASAINQALLERGIFGGKDLSTEFPSLGQSILFCVSEVHTRADLDRLAAALMEVVQ